VGINACRLATSDSFYHLPLPPVASPRSPLPWRIPTLSTWPHRRRHFIVRQSHQQSTRSSSQNARPTSPVATRTRSLATAPPGSDRPQSNRCPSQSVAAVLAKYSLGVREPSCLCHPSDETVYVSRTGESPQTPIFQDRGHPSWLKNRKTPHLKERSASTFRRTTHPVEVHHLPGAFQPLPGDCDLVRPASHWL
jgi:hypothetical protein